MKVKEMEVEQRPREKALRNGLESLNDLELVALILQSGNKNRGSLTLAHSRNSQMSFMYGFFFVKFLFLTVVCVVIVI